MKSIVVYSSKSGNTRKLAEAAFEALPFADKEIYPVSEAPDPAGYDLVVAAFWLMAGTSDPASAEYLPRVKGGRLFLAATHGAAANSAHARAAMQKARELALPAEVVGSFNCQGEVAPGFLEKARQKQPPPPWIGDAAAAMGHPDESDLQTLKAVLLSSIAPS
jgi:hypothetical protein